MTHYTDDVVLQHKTSSVRKTADPQRGHDVNGVNHDSPGNAHIEATATKRQGVAASALGVDFLQQYLHRAVKLIEFGKSTPEGSSPFNRLRNNAHLTVA